MFNNGGENKTTKETREEFKNALKELKGDFKGAVRDKKRWLYSLLEILIVIAVIALDLITKHFIYGSCKATGDKTIIKNVLIFTAVENTGASFGILKNQTMALSILSTICAVFLLFFIFYSYKTRTPLLRASIILVTGGAIGNIIDRFVFWYVRDFIFAIPAINFPVFNLADSCLTIGTILLLIYVLFFMGKDEEKKKALAATIEDKEKTKIDIASDNSNEVTVGNADMNQSMEKEHLDSGIEKKDKDHLDENI